MICILAFNSKKFTLFCGVPKMYGAKATDPLVMKEPIIVPGTGDFALVCTLCIFANFVRT